MTGQYLNDPNREAVGVEPAWAEGSGGSDTSAGSGPAGAPAGQYAEQTKALDDMTKDELLAEAEARGVDADASMTKAEIREALGS